MEVTIVYWVIYRDNGKENGSYYSILGLCRDNGKGNGYLKNDRLLLRCLWCSHGHFTYLMGPGRV